MTRNITLLTLLTFFCIECFAQIQVTFPVSRIVLQRDNLNRANITIAGNFSQLLERIEARFVPIKSGQGTETAWTTIQNNPTNGLFRGSMQIQGGWYRLEVRGFLYGVVATSTQVDRVGVGEVFVVAGQSNAQGDNSYPGGTIGAVDDRVSSIDYYSSYLDENNLPFQFSQFGNDKRMAPYNYVPWFWARLGDQLAQKLNVPILFYGAALGGIGSDLWRRSAAGEDLRLQYPTFIAVAGMPYRSLKATLQQYSTRTGIRAVLWQQGESDDLTTSTNYFNNVKYVIDKIRTDSKKSDLAWVIARSSLNPTYHQNVIDGQNQLIAQLSNVFEGPFTDEINGGGDRYDGVHFMGDGLVKAATYWNNSLNDNFFQKSTPLLPATPPTVSLACQPNADNLFLLSTSGNYSSYRWSNGQNSASTYVGAGSYFLKVTDNLGNTYTSPQINIANQPTKLTIVSNHYANFLCQGETITLSAGKDYNIKWSTGDQKATIDVKAAGSFTVTNYSLYGCAYTSDVFNVVEVPKPTTSITASGPTIFCPTDSVVLTGGGTNVNYIWSNGATKKSIAARQTGIYSLKVRDTNGCESPNVSIGVNVRIAPVNTILTDGPTTFCVGKSVNLIASNDKVKTYLWSTGDDAKQINVSKGGNYAVKVRDEFGCESPLSFITVTTLPLPQTNIIANGATTFCSGGNVRLSASNANKITYAWSTGETTKDIIVKESGNYVLKVKDSNGCESAESNVVVAVKPTPITPTIAVRSKYFIEAKNLITQANPAGDTYEWLQAGTLLQANTNYLKVKSSNIFTVRALIKYPLLNSNTLACYSNYSAPYNYIYTSDGENLTILPNPSTDGLVYVETKDDFENLSYSIYSIKGEFEKSGIMQNMKELQILDLRDLRKGMYIIKIGSDSFIKTKRILLDY